MKYDPAGDAEDEARPLTHLPWFWIGVGGAVAVVTTVVLVAVLGGGSKDPQPSLGGVTTNP